MTDFPGATKPNNVFSVPKMRENWIKFFSQFHKIATNKSEPQNPTKLTSGQTDASANLRLGFDDLCVNLQLLNKRWNFSKRRYHKY